MQARANSRCSFNRPSTAGVGAHLHRAPKYSEPLFRLFTASVLVAFQQLQGELHIADRVLGTPHLVEGHRALIIYLRAMWGNVLGAGKMADRLSLIPFLEGEHPTPVMGEPLCRVQFQTVGEICFGVVGPIVLKQH